MTDFVYANGDTVTFADGVIATAGHATAAHVDSNDRVWTMQPDLTLPAGVKPTYPVELDWGSPLTKKLAFVTLFSNGIAENLFDETVHSVTGGGSTSNFAHGDWEQTSTSTGGDNILTGIPSGDEGSVFTIYTPTSLYNYNAVFDNSGYDNDAECWIYATGELSSRYNTADTRVSKTGITANTQYKIGYSWKRNELGTGNKLYVDGVLEDSQTAGNAAIAGDISINAGRASNTHGAGIYEVFMVFNNRLSDEEMLSLHRDPYQFLKSPTPQTQIITDQPTANDRVWVI